MRVAGAVAPPASAGAGLVWQVAEDARSLVSPSALLFVGTAGARFLGLLFSVACARLLVPSDFGLLTYSLTVLTFAAILLQNAPGGLARYLSHHRESRFEQDLYFSNWLATVLVLLGLSLVLAVPIGLAAQLSGWMLVGLLVNLVGVSVVATYFAAQRGLERFADLAAFYLLANSIQLVGVLAAGLAGFRSAALFFIVYGLSSLPALLVMQRLRPLAVRFRLASVRSALLRTVANFAWPQLLQYAFYTTWLGSDLVLVLHLAPRHLTGGYAVAKTLVIALGLAPGAISAVLTPRVAYTQTSRLWRLLAAALVLIGVVVVPSVLLVLLFGHQLVMLVFGSRYLAAVQALSWLAIGTGLYSFCVALENTMVGLGRTRAAALTAGVAAVTSVFWGLALIPRLGLAGGGIAFAAGAAAELAVLTFYTARLLIRSSSGAALRVAA